MSEASLPTKTKGCFTYNYFLRQKTRLIKKTKLFDGDFFCSIQETFCYQNYYTRQKTKNLMLRRHFCIFKLRTFSHEWSKAEILINLFFLPCTFCVSHTLPYLSIGFAFLHHLNCVGKKSLSVFAILIDNLEIKTDNLGF